MSEHASFEIDASGTGDRGPAAAARSIPPLALLYSDEALLAHVESALGDMGAQVVYRAPIAQAERDALLAAQPVITLINLADCCDEHLEQVTAWLDAARIPIVFNDADISHGLEGWARARWARHLAAKLRGSDDVDPPRPAQAEPAQAAQPEPSVAPDIEQPQGFHAGSAEGVEIVPIASRPLTPGEIAALLADFPSEPTTDGSDIENAVADEMSIAAESMADTPEEAPSAQVEGDETEALSAHVDALLAEPAEAPPAEPAPWDVIVPLEDVPVAAAANDAAKPSAPSIPISSDWQLVDDPEPVVSAPRERATAAAAPRMDFDFELEPLEAAAPVAVVREREFEEMRLDGPAANNAEPQQ